MAKKKKLTIKPKLPKTGSEDYAWSKNNAQKPKDAKLSQLENYSYHGSDNGNMDNYLKGTQILGDLVSYVNPLVGKVISAPGDVNDIIKHPTEFKNYITPFIPALSKAGLTGRLTNKVDKFNAFLNTGALVSDIPEQKNGGLLKAGNGLNTPIKGTKEQSSQWEIVDDLPKFENAGLIKKAPVNPASFQAYQQANPAKGAPTNPVMLPEVNIIAPRAQYPTELGKRLQYSRDENQKLKDVAAEERWSNSYKGEEGLGNDIIGQGIGLMSMPARLPFEATSNLGKVGVEALNIANPLGGLRGFKSEIDWAKWNKEIPSNQSLIKEYNAIEQTSKANGNWMKNPDGSTFQGTPEQFVQQNSSNFKKAFPEGHTEGYRGAHQHITDFKNRDRNDWATFMSDNLDIAQDYSGSDKIASFYNPQIHTADNWVDGNYHLAFPKNAKKVIGDAEGRGWREVNWDDKIAKGVGNENVVKYHQEFLQSAGVSNKNQLSTDIYANYIKNKNNPEAVAEIQNVVDRMGFQKSPIPSTVYAVDAERVPLKSLRYNNGMFDMTNPNIYKSVAPIAVGAGIASQQEKKFGGNVNTDWEIVQDDNEWELV